MRKLVVFAIMVLSLRGHAGYFQAPLNQVQTQDLQLQLESGDSVTLNRVLEAAPLKGKSIFVIPAYFECSSTCPLFAENLRDAFKNSKTGTEGRVLFISFNAEDTASSMERFRKHHQLPAQWILAVSKTEPKTRDFLAQFNYQFQKTTDGFDHPNSGFILSKERRLWTGMLAGVDNTPEDIDRAIGEANYSELSGPTQRLVRILKQPEYLIIIGFLGVVMPLLFIIFILARKRSFLPESQVV